MHSPRVDFINTQAYSVHDLLRGIRRSCAPLWTRCSVDTLHMTFPSYCQCPSVGRAPFPRRLGARKTSYVCLLLVRKRAQSTHTCAALWVLQLSMAVKPTARRALRHSLWGVVAVKRVREPVVGTAEVEPENRRAI